MSLPADSETKMGPAGQVHGKNGDGNNEQDRKQRNLLMVKIKNEEAMCSTRGHISRTLEPGSHNNV